MEVEGATLLRREQVGAFLRLAFRLDDEPSRDCTTAACFTVDTIGKLPARPESMACSLPAELTDPPPSPPPRYVSKGERWSEGLLTDLPNPPPPPPPLLSTDRPITNAPPPPSPHPPADDDEDEEDLSNEDLFKAAEEDDDSLQLGSVDGAIGGEEELHPPRHGLLNFLILVALLTLGLCGVLLYSTSGYSITDGRAFLQESASNPRVAWDSTLRLAATAHGKAVEHLMLITAWWHSFIIRVRPEWAPVVSASEGFEDDDSEDDDEDDDGMIVGSSRAAPPPPVEMDEEEGVVEERASHTRLGSSAAAAAGDDGLIEPVPKLSPPPKHDNLGLYHYHGALGVDAEAMEEEGPPQTMPPAQPELPGLADLAGAVQGLEALSSNMAGIQLGLAAVQLQEGEGEEAGEVC